jgi:hypothetical protein
MRVTDAQRGKYKIRITTAEKKMYEANDEVYFDGAYKK